LVKKMPYAIWTSVRMSQEPNQHGNAEHYVDHQGADGVDQALPRMQDDASLQNRVVRPFHLLFVWYA
jgi:hypothetical protein